MTKLLVISDSHGAETNIETALFAQPDTDVVIFLGDGLSDLGCIDRRICAVRGNCDGWSEYESEQRLRFENVDIFMTHGHRYSVKYRLDTLLYRAMECEASLALYGHTHRQSVIREAGITMINPGSIRNGDYIVLIINGTDVGIIRYAAFARQSNEEE